jgi:acetoacetate decarboxylase
LAAACDSRIKRNGQQVPPRWPFGIQFATLTRVKSRYTERWRMSRKNQLMEYLLKLWPNYAGAATIAGIGLSMARFDEFAISRALFWIAAVFLCITDFIWQLVTDTPVILRVFNGIVSAGIIFVIFPMLFDWLKKREKRI